MTWPAVRTQPEPVTFPAPRLSVPRGMRHLDKFMFAKRGVLGGRAAPGQALWPKAAGFQAPSQNIPSPAGCHVFAPGAPG